MTRARFRGLIERVTAAHPDLDDPEAAIAAGEVLVDGRVITNPSARVPPGAAIVVRPVRSLRGEAKLRAALDAFAVEITGRVAVDAGAAAGGFTKVLLERGARRVYAVDVGHGQLLGSLRQDARVVNLEATNLADLNRTLVPDTIDVVTLDLSYLSLAAAVPQLDATDVAADADLVGLAKPMFELGLPAPPSDDASLAAALTRARSGVEAAGWRAVSDLPSPVTGARGAREFLLHARRG